jgi:hypothetical protein
MELQYSTARGSEIDTAVKSESARNVRMTATKAVTGVALSKSVTCGYKLLLRVLQEMSVRGRSVYHLHAVSQYEYCILANNFLGRG